MRIEIILSIIDKNSQKKSGSIFECINIVISDKHFGFQNKITYEAKFSFLCETQYIVLCRKLCRLSNSTKETI